MRNSIRNVALLAAGAGVAMFGTSFCETEQPPQEATVEAQALESYTAPISTQIGTLATHSSINLKIPVSQQVTPGLGIPKTGIKIIKSTNIRWEDTYRGLFPASVDFNLRGLVRVTTTASNIVERKPLSTDEVVVEIDPSDLFLNRPRIDTDPPTKFVVKDGMLVERIFGKGKNAQTEKVMPPEPIFSKDGTFTTGLYKSPGQDSAKTDAKEGLVRLGRENIGENAQTTLHSVAQLEAANPSCIAKAFGAASPQELAETAFNNELRSKGYSNIRFEYKPGAEWPKPPELEDERGQTYAERRLTLSNKLGDNIKLVNIVDCKIGNVANTSKVSSTIVAPGNDSK